MMDGWYGGMGPGWWILMVLVWVLIVAAIVWAVTQLFPGRAPREREEPRAEDAQAILDRRLASGEIDPETYDTLRERLHARPVRG